MNLPAPHHTRRVGHLPRMHSRMVRRASRDCMTLPTSATRTTVDPIPSFASTGLSPTTIAIHSGRLPLERAASSPRWPP